MFNLRSYDLIKDYSFGTERSTRIKDYHLKGCMEGQGLILMISARTNLSYLPKYFRKMDRESKAKQKRGRKRQFNSTGPTFLWMPPGFLNNYFVSNRFLKRI